MRAEYCGTRCQIRIDWTHPHRGIVDLKTCDELDWFEADARRYRYMTQFAFYQAVLAKVISQFVPVHVVAVEKREPFRCGVWRLSDGYLARFFKDVADLDKINWEAVEATDFRPMQVKEGKQAEFLVYGRFPWKLVEHIGVRNASIEQQVYDILRDVRHKPLVTVERNWYY